MANNKYGSESGLKSASKPAARQDPTPRDAIYLNEGPYSSSLSIILQLFDEMAE